MIKSFTATTREIDDGDAAVAEILAKLDIENNLLKNSLGIISCFSDFAETGVLKEICAALPFDCIGTTSNLCATSDEIDQIILVLTVLTSDDCDFRTISIRVGEDYEDAIGAGMSAFLADSEAKPAMFFGYFPLMNTLTTDVLLNAIDKASGGTPIFGSVSVDHHIEYHTAQTLHNGEAYRESFVLGAIFGPVSFTCEIASISDTRVRKQKAIITEYAGNILISVNEKSALEYFIELGLTEEEIKAGLGLMPLFVDNNDGSKSVARAVFAVTPDGHAVCSGAVPVNGKMSLGSIVGDDILHTSEDAFRTLSQKDGVIFSYSCIGRYFTLGTDNTAEACKINETAGDASFHFASVGGEICPLPDASGKLNNFFHSYTNVFCRIS